MIAENPFAVQVVQPGAIPFLCEPNSAAPNFASQSPIEAGQNFCSDLLGRWILTEKRGAILGAHGSGKSTLLLQLQKMLRQKFATTEILLVKLTSSTRSLKQVKLQSLIEADVLFIDGYEQLSVWSKFELWIRQRQQRFGLLVTAHRTTLYPTLHEVAVKLAQFKIIVDFLEQQAKMESITLTSEIVQAAWKNAKQNPREALFLLYDWYEQERRKTSST